jgi:hypothetical protein
MEGDRFQQILAELIAGFALSENTPQPSGRSKNWAIDSRGNPCIPPAGGCKLLTNDDASVSHQPPNALPTGRLGGRFAYRRCGASERSVALTVHLRTV